MLISVSVQVDFQCLTDGRVILPVFLLLGTKEVGR
nr:MAG TPA: hypothetical protein [Caudoviricetes sp.]